LAAEFGAVVAEYALESPARVLELGGDALDKSGGLLGRRPGGGRGD
jgi:hypothetical protein